MKLGVHISAEDYAELEGEIPDDLYAQLATYAGLDLDDPFFDENHMTWSDFYDAYCDWNDDVLERRIKILNDFGPHDEMYQAILDMPSSDLEDLLYRKAVGFGVRFTASELEDMGRWDAIPEESDEPDEAEPAIRQSWEKPGPPKSGLGFWATLSVFFLSLFGFDKSKKDTGCCDGDCENCPPHYGYRYGRWHYGHGHQHSCERGGNGCATGRMCRD